MQVVMQGDNRNETNTQQRFQKEETHRTNIQKSLEHRLVSCQSYRDENLIRQLEAEQNILQLKL